MRLHYNRGSRATRPRWLLEELGVPYDLVQVPYGPEGTKSEPHLRLHPHGQLPAFEDDDLVLFESAAICLYLADKFPEKGFAPPVGSAARGHYYKWIIYGMATAEPPVYQHFSHTLRLPEDKRNPAMVQEAAEKFAPIARTLSAAVTPGPYLLGAQFTAADVVLGSILAWANGMGMCGDYPDIVAYVDRLKARPAFKAGRT